MKLLTLAFLMALAMAAHSHGSLSQGADACGNGQQDAGEECDDGNGSDNDGCSSLCIVECGFNCDNGKCTTVCGDGIKAGTEKCDKVYGCDPNTCTEEPGFECLPDDNFCRHICGNGIKDEDEDCDGGHMLQDHFPSPYCTTDCKISPQWECFETPEKPCVKVCPESAALSKLRGY